MSENIVPHKPIVLYTLIGVVAFSFGYLSILLIKNWDTNNILIYESSLAKYEVMTGEQGPTTYLIFHNDFAALQQMAAANEGILGVEQHVASNVAKMAFVDAKSPLISEVRRLASVSNMINRNVPMLCH